MSYGQSDEISAITLRRGPCFGFCPIYEVTLQADGTATWTGERFVDKAGRFEGEVPTQDFRRLAEFVERAGFFGWDPDYSSGVVDTPDYHLEVQRGGETKTVRQNASEEPPDFWVIAALVDGLAQEIDWKPAPPPASRAPADDELSRYRGLPSPESCRIIEFDQATVVTLRTFPPRYILKVNGSKPWLGMNVDLVPRMYIRQPEYHGIEVVGCLNGPSPAVLAPYSVSLELEGSLGTKGIEVIGASRSETIDVPSSGGDPGSDCFDWVAYHDHMPPGPATLRVIGTCQFPQTGYTVELRKGEPQGINPADLILDLRITPPEIGGPAFSEVEARYEEETDVEYATVTIRPGPTIPVSEVH